MYVCMCAEMYILSRLLIILYMCIYVAFDIHRPFLLTDIIPNINHEDVVGRRIVRIKFRARPRRSYLRDRRLASSTSTSSAAG